MEQQMDLIWPDTKITQIDKKLMNTPSSQIGSLTWKIQYSYEPQKREFPYL